MIKNVRACCRWVTHNAAVMAGVVGVSVTGLLLAAPAAWAAGDNVGANLESLLQSYATELYGGIVGVVSLIFLLNRRYTELAVFLFAAIVVAWMVFVPSDIGAAAKTIGTDIFG